MNRGWEGGSTARITCPDREGWMVGSIIEIYSGVDQFMDIVPGRSIYCYEALFSILCVLRISFSITIQTHERFQVLMRLWLGWDILRTFSYDTWSSLWISQMIRAETLIMNPQSIYPHYSQYQKIKSHRTSPETDTALIVIVIQCRSRYYSWTHWPRPNKPPPIRGVETQRSVVCIGNQSE